MAPDSSLIGDAFGMTNPQGARGVTLGMESAAVLADLLHDHGPDSVVAGLDAWGKAQLLPWFSDHVEWDAALLQLWSGRPVDATARSGWRSSWRPRRRGIRSGSPP